MAHDGCCIGSCFAVACRGGDEVTFSRLSFPVDPAVLSAFFYDKANAFQLPDGGCVHLFVASQYDFESLFYVLWVRVDFFVNDWHESPFFLHFLFYPSLIFFCSIYGFSAPFLEKNCMKKSTASAVLKVLCVFFWGGFYFSNLHANKNSCGNQPQGFHLVWK